MAGVIHNAVQQIQAMIGEAGYLAPLGEIGFTRFRPIKEWPKSETSDFG
jgi:hypothetical protein